MRPSRRRLVVGVSSGLLALLVLRIVLWRPFAVEGPPPADGYTRVAGVVHVHTTLSDGGGTPEEVAAAARRAGLGFVAITDHNNLDAKWIEGYRAGVLVLVGAEISTTVGHLLGLGISDPVFRFSGGDRDALEDVRDLGGLAVAAHPSSPRPDFRWSGWDLPGPWGLELVNGDSQWRSAGWPRLLRTAGLYGLNRRYALLGSLTPPADTLARWDALLAARDVPGIAGSDAHSRVPVFRQRGVRFPSYESLFALARNHVLLERKPAGDAGADAREILAALGRGRSYVGLDALAPADGFFFVAEAGDRRWSMGDTVAPAPNLLLRAGGRMPRAARLVLLRDGRPVQEAQGGLEHRVGAEGAYRVEVYAPGWAIPWVLSNPIYVHGEAVAAKRRERASWPADPEVPQAVQILDDFEGATRLTPGAAPPDAIEAGVLDAQGGSDGRGAARLGFRLDAPTPQQPHPFAALVDWTRRDLGGRRGLVFRLRGDGAYRLWVQVRDENPASADEGTEWWFTSVRTGPEWRSVVVPFERLRSINPRTDGRLDLDKVRAIVFVVDRGAVKPGTRGRIWLDRLGVY